MTELPRFPHCDQRILHAPGECEYCDANPQWQELRKAWGIAFTGHTPAIDGDRCGKRIHRDTSPLPNICMQGKGHEGDCLPLEPYEVLPCPADYAVERGTRSDHARWPGNTAAGYTFVTES